MGLPAAVVALALLPSCARSPAGAGRELREDVGRRVCGLGVPAAVRTAVLGRAGRVRDPARRHASPSGAGPTHAITRHHFEVYTAVAIAFLVPGGGAAYLGPPDMLFFALFLACCGALEPPRRLDVDRDDVHVRTDRDRRDGGRLSAASRRCRFSPSASSSRTPTCSGALSARRRIRRGRRRLLLRPLAGLRAERGLADRERRSERSRSPTGRSPSRPRTSRRGSRSRAAPW